MLKLLLSRLDISNPVWFMLFVEQLLLVILWHNHHHMILIFTLALQGISLAIPKQALITSALKITLNSWNRYTLKGRNRDDMYKSRYGHGFP